jgi:hypothetical protein
MFTFTDRIVGLLIYIPLIFQTDQDFDMNIIVGSSRARELSNIDPLRANRIEVWSLPGGKFLQMKSLVKKHFILNHGGPATLSPGKPTFYIVAGLCDITSKIKDRSQNYTEIIFTENPDQAISRVLKDINTLKSYIENQDAIPVFSTIVPCNIEIQNQYLFDRGTTQYLKYSHKYEEMQAALMHVIENINQEIPTINSKLHLATPMLHRTVFQNKKGKQYF